MHREKPHPRSAHSFTALDINRAILIGGANETKSFHDIYVFHLNSMVSCLFVFVC